MLDSLLLTGDLLVAGHYRAAEGNRTFEDVSPVTGEALRRVAAATSGDVQAAVEAAAAAFPAWSRTPYVERRARLLAAADLLQAESGATIDLLALETGAVRGWAEMNVREAVETLREAAAQTSARSGEIYPSAHPGTINLSVREPAGVVLAIIPWNAPLVLSARAAAIAVALGNTVVFRPSEEAPFAAAHVIADVLRRAGVPDGVVNVVTTAPSESPERIAELIEHPAIQRVVFIGSTAVGRRIAAIAGAALTPAVMELGGKNTTIVRADADLDRVIPQLAAGAFANTGQVCMCSERIVVDASIAQEVMRLLGEHADAMRTGDPRDPAVDLGPVINRRAADRFRTIVDDAIGTGARVVAGGTIDGLYPRPTVLADLTRESRFHLEESFLPITTVLSAADDDEAVRYANEGGYGLIASVLSEDVDAAEVVGRRLNTGALHVNGASVGDEPHVPFGGVGASGFGRLGGEESARFFTRQRSIYRHGA